MESTQTVHAALFFRINVVRKPEEEEEKEEGGGGGREREQIANLQ